MVCFQVRHAAWFAAAFVSLAFAAMTAQGDFTVGSDIFLEEFNGSAINSSVWEPVIGGNGTITLSAGTVSFLTEAGSDNAYITSLNALNFTSSPNEWGAEVKFTLYGTYSSWNPNRHFILLDGLTTATENGWTNQGIDLRLLRNTSQLFNLGWNGWDNDSERLPTILNTGYLDGVSHIAKLHRKTDGTVDVYMDGDLISNQALINGVNPTQLRIGDITGTVEGHCAIDYIKIGAVPEPSSIAMVMTVFMGLLAYAWRKRG